MAGNSIFRNVDDESINSQEYGAWSLIWAGVFLLPNLRFVQFIMEEKELKVRVSRMLLAVLVL